MITPNSLYNLSRIIGEETYRVGVILYPDETDRTMLMPFIFEKKLTIIRGFEFEGLIQIEDDIIFETGCYTSCNEPLEMLIRKSAKLKIGQATLKAVVTDTPIVLLPEEDDKPLRWHEPRKYYDIPNSWFDVSSEAGMAFFESESELRANWHKNPECIPSGDRYENLKLYGISSKSSEEILYDSSLSNEKNTETLLNFPRKYSVNTDFAEYDEIIQNLLSGELL